MAGLRLIDVAQIGHIAPLFGPLLGAAGTGVITGVGGFIAGRRTRARQARGHWDAVLAVLLELASIQEITDRHVASGAPIRGRFVAWNTHYGDLRRRNPALPDELANAVAAVYSRLNIMMAQPTKEESGGFRDLVGRTRGMLMGYCMANHVLIPTEALLGGR